jgi:DNA polymerase Ligase (LigD)
MANKQDPLRSDRGKRDSGRTPEPPGGRKRGSRRQPRFVVHKHDATTLHYDFRLEAAGVLKSWAVPKGPSTNPKDRRLAMPTEDHPLEGRKLRGGYALTRIGKGKRERWLLVKMADEQADARRKPVTSQPESVVSGRTIEEVAAEAEAGEDLRG